MAKNAPASFDGLLGTYEAIDDRDSTGACWASVARRE
jgi:hypothetical protein